MDIPSVASIVKSASTCIRVPSRVEWIEQTVQFLTQQAMDCGVCEAPQSFRISLALHEALTNAVVHGNLEVSSELKELLDGAAFARMLAERASDPRYASREVEILFEYNSQTAQWTMTDEGRGFDADEVLHRIEQSTSASAESIESLLASGRGIQLMRSIMSDIRFDLGGRRVIMSHVRELSEAAARPSERRRRVGILLRGNGGIDWDKVEELAAAELGMSVEEACRARVDRVERVLLEVSDPYGPIYLPAKVCGRRITGDDAFQLFCRIRSRAEIDEEITESREVGDAIARLLERFGGAEIEHHELRTHQRRVYTERVEVIGPAGQSPRHAFARDLSRGGIAFITTFPLPPGPIEVRLPRPDNGQTLRVSGIVRRCDQLMAGFYDVGVRFIGWA
jgi:anti-sigma regulatory factor (Ser/Thr protein kinase)